MTDHVTDLVIPDEEIQAAAKAIYESPSDALSREGWDHAPSDIQAIYKAEGLRALQAAARVRKP